MSTPLAPTPDQIGRRFSIVGAVPTATLVVFVAVIVLSGAPGRAPDVDRVATAVGSLSAFDVAVLLLAITALAIIVHPFQLPLVRLLEGYWPAWGRVGISAERARGRHSRRRRALHDLCVESAALNRWERRCPELIARRKAYAAQAYTRIPYDDARVMPTRLGNVLRAAEDLSGDRYGLDAIEVIPRLYAVAPESFIARVQDARNQLDVTARFVVVWLVATGVSVVLLAWHGPWAAVGLVTYALAWVSYRGCLHAAASYGQLLVRAIDLYRFDLLTQLHVPLPDNVAQERARNRTIMSVLTGEHFLERLPDPVPDYSHPAADLAVRSLPEDQPPQ